VYSNAKARLRGAGADVEQRACVACGELVAVAVGGELGEELVDVRLGRARPGQASVIADRWGVTDAEVGRHYPCDDVVPQPVLQLWRGVTVEATRNRLWPWVAQVRLAPYSYDWIDNLGRQSPQELRGLSEPVVGEPFTTAGTRRLGRILAVEPQRHLTAEIARGVVMCYLLSAEGDATRLLLKVVASRGRAVAPLLSLGDLVMARRQLLNFKRLAEG